MEPLVLDGTLDALEPIRDYVTNAANAAGLAEPAAYRLVLAMDEIATNIVTYGYAGMVPPGKIRVSASLDGSRLRMVLEDTGCQFDPRNRELPSDEDLQQDLAERPIGGLGIFLAVNGVDEFDYQHEGELNRNIFIMNRSGN